MRYNNIYMKSPLEQVCSTSQKGKCVYKEARATSLHQRKLNRSVCKHVKESFTRAHEDRQSRIVKY
jgi:hypothetical protein